MTTVVHHSEFFKNYLIINSDTFAKSLTKTARYNIHHKLTVSIITILLGGIKISIRSYLT